MRLILLCHGATAAMRTGGFPTSDDALDERAIAKLAGARVAAARVVTSPDRAARETAAALSLPGTQVPALRDIDHGGWSGKRFTHVQADAPAAFAHWLAEPWHGTPAGETFAAATTRVGGWLETIADADTLAIVPPMIVRAVLAAAIGIAPDALMRIDITPLTTTTLSRHRGWRLQRLGGAIGD